jgi:hypothetical protein
MEKVPRVHWALLQLGRGALAVPNHVDPLADGGHDTLVASNKGEQKDIRACCGK